MSTYIKLYVHTISSGLSILIVNRAILLTYTKPYVSIMWGLPIFSGRPLHQDTSKGCTRCGGDKWHMKLAMAEKSSPNVYAWFICIYYQILYYTVVNLIFMDFMDFLMPFLKVTNSQLEDVVRYSNAICMIFDFSWW